jgi:transposase-like protein
MATGKPRDERKEEHWRQRIHDWQVSGLSVSAFCARRGLNQQSFYAWRRVLRRRDSEKPHFVPLRLRDDDLPTPITPALEVLLASGRRLRVAPGFDVATLRQLLAVLEEGSSC